MVKIYTALGYDAFLNLLRDLEKAEEPIFLLFTASRGPKGKSWNSECEKAASLFWGETCLDCCTTGKKCLVCFTRGTNPVDIHGVRHTKMSLIAVQDTTCSAKTSDGFSTALTRAQYVNSIDHPETAIEEAAHLAPKDSRLVYVQVGNKATWEDPKCFFRKDPVVQLQALPTLFLWGSRLKLQERQCSELESLRKFFEAASRTAEDTPRQEYVEYVQTQDKS